MIFYAKKRRKHSCSPASTLLYIHHCKFTKWLPPWRKGGISCLWIKSVFDCLTIGIIHETMVVHVTWVWTFFNNYSNHPRMCVLSPLCGNVVKHSPFKYIYIIIYIYTCVSAVWTEFWPWSKNLRTWGWWNDATILGIRLVIFTLSIANAFICDCSVLKNHKIRRW